METQVENMQSVAVLALNGRLDSHTVPALKTQIADYIDARSAHLVLDISDVTFIDSRALAAIVQGMHACNGIGGELYLAGPTNSVRRIFELTRLDKAIKIYSNRLEALAAINE